MGEDAVLFDIPRGEKGFCDAVAGDAGCSLTDDGNHVLRRHGEVDAGEPGRFCKTLEVAVHGERPAAVGPNGIEDSDPSLDGEIGKRKRCAGPLDKFSIEITE
ncbi:hypothetical protein SDC9_41289 [bioreactor metagenome]|uniref:Uncharacterized protein n=1 Tax=bioreactor metagenome TaxID=1076179 RepID=A0A644VXS5_9ZZZZ